MAKKEPIGMDTKAPTPQPALEGPDYPACNADKELYYLIRARYSLIYVASWEERRVINALEKIAADPEIGSDGVLVWDSARGVVTSQGYDVEGGEAMKDPESVIDHIIKLSESSKKLVAQAKQNRGPIFVLCDIFRYLIPGQGWTPELERKIRSLTYALRKSQIAVVMISPELHLPVSLEKVVTVIDYPLPDPAYMDVIVKHAASQLVPHARIKLKDDVPHEEVVRSLLGLTVSEAEDALAKSAVMFSRFDVPTLLELKRQIVRKGGLLDFMYAKQSFDVIGGLDGVKQFIRLRKNGFTDDGASFGLKVPKGIFLAGIQGTGKSLCAKAIAHELKFPLIKLEMGAMFGSLMGESEAKMRRALQQVEGVAPCVLFIDEIDKDLAGATGVQTDSGTTKRVIGKLLNWMQERAAPVLVVATANHIMGLPPELFRPGRFDVVLFVDLPNDKEREVIFSIHLKKLDPPRDPGKFNLKDLVAATSGFSGAEIAFVIEEAMFVAYDEKREFDTNDVLAAISVCVPLSKSRKADLDQIREDARHIRRAADEVVYKHVPEAAAAASRFNLS